MPVPSPSQNGEAEFPVLPKMAAKPFPPDHRIVSGSYHDGDRNTSGPSPEGVNIFPPLPKMATTLFPVPQKTPVRFFLAAAFRDAPNWD